MAFITNFTCKECEKQKREIINNSGICQECRSKISNKKRRIYLAGLKGMTIEERLEKIEIMLYDLNIQNRLQAIESINAQY